MSTFSLANHFLIAMPNMTDPLFAKSVVYLCEHTENGAMGVVLNRPSEMTLSVLFEQVGLHLGRPEWENLPVYFGGPVQTDRGFVLHQPAGEWQSSLQVTDQTALTTSRDILNAMVEGGGPERLFLCLGYSGWDAGQLEHELAQNAWLSVEAPADLDLIFDLPSEHRFNAAMSLLGIDMLSLSDQVGHA